MRAHKPGASHSVGANRTADWDDPTQEPVDGVGGDAGDRGLIYGNAIMDTEHAQYFEIHPVRGRRA